MRTRSVVVLMLTVLAFSQVNSQELPARHRGMYPRLLDDGKVIDLTSRQLGYISKDGKICDVTGLVLGMITASGELSYAVNKEIIGVIKKGGLKTNTGQVIRTDRDGVVMVSANAVAFVDKGYLHQSHGCALFYFFSVDNEEAIEVDRNLK